MLADILLTIPILILFLGTAARCLAPRPGTPDRHAPGRRELMRVFGCAIALRVFMLAAMALCCAISGREGGLHSQFTRWDAGHYVKLVEQGYAGYQENGQHLFLVFYPMYVWAVRAVRLLVPSTVAAGLLVSVLSFAGGCCFVYRTAAKRLGQQTARDSLILLSLFPFSFFYGTVMTEGLFLLTTSAACYYALERRWLLYGLWGALAALTRMTGVLVLVPAAVELLDELRPFERPLAQSLKRALPGFIKRLPLLVMPLLGSGAYLLLNLYVDGDPLAFRVHQGHWYQGGMWVTGVLRYLWSYFLGNLTDPNAYAIWLPELALFAAVFLILALSLRRGDAQPALLAYAFCYFIANYSLSWLLSAGRYMSCCFPLFIFTAALLRDRPVLRQGVFTAQAALLGIYMYAYTTGAQVM